MQYVFVIYDMIFARSQKARVKFAYLTDDLRSYPTTPIKIKRYFYPNLDQPEPI